MIGTIMKENYIHRMVIKLNNEYVTLSEIKRLLANNKKCKQLVIFKVANLCGTWYTDKLLSKAMNELDCIALRKLYIAFRIMQNKSSPGLYKQLYSILVGYFERMSAILLVNSNGEKYYDYINMCNQRSYAKLRNILLDEDDGYGRKKQTNIKSKIVTTEDGMIIDINLEIL